MMVPVGRLVLLRSVPRNEVVQALATLTIPALVGPVIGPPLGGFITTYLHWRWIFFINIPIGILGVVLPRSTSRTSRRRHTPPLDLRGFLLSGVGLAALMLGLASGGRHLIPPSISVASVVVGILCIGGYVLHASRSPHPVLQLKLLKIPTYRVSILGGFCFRIGVGAIPFLLPLMLQVGFGLNPLQSGFADLHRRGRRDVHEDDRQEDSAVLRLPARADDQCAGSARPSSPSTGCSRPRRRTGSSW